MAFSKARRLSDLITANAQEFITSAHIANTAITGTDIHSTFDLTGKTVTVANASTGDNDTTAANTAFVQQEIAALVDSSPSALNTLNELAAALGDDANFSTTVNNNIATKLPLAGGTLTGDLVLKSDGGSDVINVVHSGNTVQLVTIGQSSDNSGNGVIQLKRNNGVLHSQIHSHGSTYFNGGNVGIGFASGTPGAKLHIRKTAAATQHYDSYATAIIEDTEARLQLVATDGGSNAASLILSNEEKHWGLVNHGPSENNTFGIGYYASSSSGIDVADSLSSPFAITPGGYVGIGTNTPRYNLTVNGNNSTAIGIGVDNASGSSTLDIAALGTGYNNHGAAGGEVWFFSPDNINIGGATGQTNNIKFIANNNLNMVIKGDGSGIDMNQKTTVERTVNGSGSVSYEEILKVSRIGGATSNNQREAAISFFDAANSTYTAMITGVRTSPAGNYDGGLSIYTNSHSQNANASNISELVSGRVVDFGANQATTFYGDVYVSGANHRISQNGVTREAKGGYVAGNATVSYTVNHTNQSSFKVQAAMSHYGIMTSYGAAHEGIYGNGSGGLYSVLTTNHTSGASGSWSVTRVDTDNITVTKNAGTYNGGGYYYIIVEGANL